MKLYKHYKNKPYKYIGTAKHSETLEEMVIYETLYHNPEGKIWVRPKEMFFESISSDEQTVPRFKKIPLEIVESTNITEADINSISLVIEKAFGEWDAKWFYAKFKNHNRFYLIKAVLEGQVVGFKLGYEEESSIFYSWLGGVIPEYRNLGIASTLINKQHEWCREQGYKKVQTKTQNRFREMFILNLKHGFSVIGCHESEEGGFKIILEKPLI